MIVQNVNNPGASELKHDPEWLELIGQAKRCGLTQKDIRCFLGTGKKD